MNSNKILASLCYFSYFFAPLLFPLIVMIVADKGTRRHGLYALLLHIAPVIIVIIWLLLFVFAISDQISLITVEAYFMPATLISVFIVIVAFIWNIIMGIIVLFSSDE